MSGRPDDVSTLAKKAVVASGTDTVVPPNGVPRGLKVDELYVVWTCYVLGNWKALVSTDLVSNRYWEVTRNTAKGETYVDLYVKSINVVVPD